MRAVVQRSASVDFAAVYAATAPAVVSLSPSSQTSPTAGRLGAGLTVGTRDQFIITAGHVVRGFESYRASYADGTSANVEVVTTDPRSDLALLRRLDGPGSRARTSIALRDPESIQVGEQVATIGAPLGLANSMTTGIVSALGRTPRELQLERPGIDPELPLVQTDAVMHAGNSGGPLLDTDGRVVGIIVLAYGVTQRVGFAARSDIVQRLVRDAEEPNDP